MHAAPLSTCHVGRKNLETWTTLLSHAPVRQAMRFPTTRASRLATRIEAMAALTVILISIGAIAGILVLLFVIQMARAFWIVEKGTAAVVVRRRTSHIAVRHFLTSLLRTLPRPFAHTRVHVPYQRTRVSLSSLTGALGQVPPRAAARFAFCHSDYGARAPVPVAVHGDVYAAGRLVGVHGSRRASVPD